MHYKKLLKNGITFGLAVILFVSSVSVDVNAKNKESVPINQLVQKSGSLAATETFKPSDPSFPSGKPSMEETKPPEEGTPPEETAPPEEINPPEEPDSPETQPPEETAPPDGGNLPDETKPSEETQPPQETEQPEDLDKPEESQPPEEPVTPGESPTESENTKEPQTGSPDEPESTNPADGDAAKYSSNDALIQAQEIIEAPTIMEDFRFVTVEKVYALANIESVMVYEEMDETSRVVGQMGSGDVCFVLKEENQWIYIESGVVRGFVKSESLLLGEEAQKAVNKKKEKHVSLTLELHSLQKSEVIDEEEQEEAVPSSERRPGQESKIKVSAAPSHDSRMSKRKDTEEKARYTVNISDLKHNGQVSYSLKLNGIKKDDQYIGQSEIEKTQAEENPAVSEVSDIIKDEPNEIVEAEQKNNQDIQERLEQKQEELLEDLQRSELTFAKADIKPIENIALNYTRTTVKETVVAKRYAVAMEETNVLAGDKEDAQVVGILPKNGVAYVLADIEKPWIYIESGDVRGFVSRTQLLLGDGAEEVVEKAGEETLKTASESVKPQENPALYYTLTSIKEGRISSAIRESVVNFARQFIGNPYVWGGTSLTNGADCSGFVQTIFNNYYGYSLPRVAEDQAQYGIKIRVEDAQPGDLIFYAKNGYIYHVVMYAGNGKTIEAQSTKTGIVEGQVDTGNAVWATRFIDDTDDTVIAAVNQKAEDSGMAVGPQPASASQLGEFLGNFKLTSYCNCELCCGQWAGGPTASGTEPTQGRTVAMGGLPFGTKLVINGLIYTVEDRGTPYGHIDIYRNSHDDCNQFGVQFADVYLLKD